MSLKNDWTPNDTLKNNNVNDIANATNTNTQHRETKINKDTFVHGLKYNDSKNSLILDGESGEVEIGGIGNANDITFDPDNSGLISDNVSDVIKEINNNIKEHEILSVLNPDGVHDVKCSNNEVYVYQDNQWKLLDVTVKHRGTRVTGGDGVHGIRYDLSDSQLKYKDNSNQWQIIPTGQQAETMIDEHKEKSILNAEGVHDLKYDESSQKLQYKKDSTWNDINTGIEEHKNLSIASENGVHNFKYDPVTKSLYYYHDGQWLVAEIEGTGKVSVSGLTADTIKSGVTVVVKRGEEEVTRIVGTFTNDSNATSSDLLSGKTAYVSGQKITGNIITRNGDQFINTPSVSGSYLYTPQIPNGNYNNARFYFNKGNLSPENIKQGVNIFGVNGSLKTDSVNGIFKLIYQIWRHPKDSSYTYGVTNVCWQILDTGFAKSLWNSNSADSVWGTIDLSSFNTPNAGRIQFLKNTNVRIRKYTDDITSDTNIKINGYWSVNIRDNQTMSISNGSLIEIYEGGNDNYCVESYCFFEI